MVGVKFKSNSMRKCHYIFSVYITSINQRFHDKYVTSDISAFFEDIMPIINKYGKNNITFIGDFNADITRKFACPRSTVFS